MSTRVFNMGSGGAALLAVSRLVAALLVVLAWSGPLRAHEVQPAVADLTIAETRVEIAIRLNLEAPLAGIDLEGLQNTNDAENAADYDRMRALPPMALAEALSRDWARLAELITLRAGDTDLVPLRQNVEIPEIGNLESPRFSRLTIAADLPPDGAPIVFGWDASLGTLIVRQMGVENGYTAFLTNGALTDPIPQSGAAGDTASAAFVDYVFVGFDHIVPLGLDHILFVLGLFFLALKLGPLLWQITAFTAAHTVTLALGALGIVQVPAEVVEPLIALSIVYVGVENVLSSKMQPWRPLVVFAFGLLHGLGFASVLTDFGLGASHFVPKLIGFNIGVEIGQLAVIAAAWLAIGIHFARAPWYRPRLSAPVSIGIAVIALFWFFERMGRISGEGFWALLATLTEGTMPALEWSAWAAGLIVVCTIIAVLVDDARVDNACGFLTSFAAFVVVTGAFTAGAYWIMVGLVLLWILALRLQTLAEAGAKWSPDVDAR
ncbi:MAG: HupE/UreJ family protein [Pseudomonadota bacterium]